MAFSCFLCGFPLEGIDSLLLHLKLEHRSNKTYYCKDCNRKYGAQWSSYRKHLINVHKVALHGSSGCAETDSCQNSGDDKMDCDVDVGSADVGLSEGTSEIDASITVDFDDSFSRDVDVLVAKLYSKTGYPRNLVNSVIQDFTDFLSGHSFKILKNVCLENLAKETPKDIRDTLSDMFETLSNPFEHLSSEYKRFKHFQSLGSFIPPESYTIDSRIENVKGEPQMRDITGQVIPLRKVLQKFLELPDVFTEIDTFLKEVQSDDTMLQNVVQSDIWKRKRSMFREDDIVFPLSVDFDDFQPNNALGPHCESLGAVYVCLPCLPPYLQSKLENIFLALLFNAEDRKHYGNVKTFRPLLDELRYLETEGIICKTPIGPKRVFFVTVIIMGDNKGLNEITGFVEGFSANFPCRICRAPKHEIAEMLGEKADLMRTKDNYEQDVIANNMSVTGVKEKCIFTALRTFEMPTDVSVDPFHDLNEGVCHYTMLPVLKHFHSKDDNFIQLLNLRMYTFDFGIDNDNRPPSITVDRLDAKKLKLTGAEMATFVRLFGVLVGDLVEEDDEFWLLYLLLRDIMSLVYCSKLPDDAGSVLAIKVKEHNGLYVKLTGNTLKPKHHNLNHYGTLLKRIGSIAACTTIRCEGKHKSLKSTADVCSSRVNLARTVATKEQLAFCYRITCNTSILSSRLVVGPGNFTDLRDLAYFNSLKKFLPEEIVLEADYIFVPKWVDFKGSVFKPKMVLLVGFDREFGCPLFSVIEIVLVHQNQPLFVCSALHTVGYYSHVRGFQVRENVTKIITCVAADSLYEPRPLSVYKMTSGEKIIIPRYCHYG